MRRYPCLEEDLRTAIEGRLFFFPRLSSLYHTRRNGEQKNLDFSKLRDKQGREATRPRSVEP
ncbi:unnamed protein product [Prunus armeniaca]|uniref:Uncharacterized protein n=1 Tax=Prunus armeniaca TaxID=36596 RepID=A0A6J5UWM1_PRUAR|nr:hypothetical protein GBA52_015370 [Prunus armeniaca]CAB4281096.1 unnamed protein product [Prunus armeniaca]CAB4311507.1 unnamed protein product [Prunus armeniaca]